MVLERKSRFDGGLVGYQIKNLRNPMIKKASEGFLQEILTWWEV